MAKSFYNILISMVLIFVFLISPAVADSDIDKTNNINDRKNNMDKNSINNFDLKRKIVMLNSGYEMPILGLGTYSLTGKQCYDTVLAFLKAGGRLIDTAYMYKNEEEVGKAIRDSNIKRSEIFVITPSG